MKEVNLKLNVNEVNMVIKALGQLPYNQVYEIIGRIHTQASEQVNSDTMEFKSQNENHKNQ